MKKYIITGHVFFGIIFLLACLFYLERILYADTSFYFFKLVNFSKINIEANRFSVIFTQILPLLTIKLNLPLNYVVFSYSISFVLIYYIVYLICVYKLKKPEAGILILLALVLGIRHSFYHTATETHQAVVYVSLFYAWLNYPWNVSTRILRIAGYYIINILLIALCYFSHPVTLFPILFIIGYYIVYNRDWKNYLLYMFIILIIFAYSLKFLFTNEQSYEGQIFTSLRNSFDIISNFYNLYSLNFFLKRITNIYLFSVIITILVTVFYIRKGAYLRLIYYLFSLFAFFIINVITYYRGDSDMAMERSYMPLSIFICIPFVKEILIENRRYDILKVAFVNIILLFSLIGIYRTGLIYKERLAYLDILLEYSNQFPEKKFIIEKKNVSMEKIIVPWAFATETLIYSSVISHDDARTFYLIDDIETFKFDDQNPDLFLCVDFWRSWDGRRLNASYFDLPEGRYKIIRNKIPD